MERRRRAVAGVLNLGALALIVFAFWLRLLPGRWARVSGVDAWYYLLYAGALRRQRRLPARLPHYLLDIEEQWYPPIFAVLLALFSERVRVRIREWVSPLIDVLQLSLLLLTASLSGADPASILLAGLIYAATPTLVHEYGTLNSRSLGSLVLTFCMLSLWGLLTQGGWQWVALGAFLGALLLLTHKMATQLFAFLLVTLTLITRNSDIFEVGLLAVAGAFVLSGGFYLKVLHGHLDILRFWRKHLAYLGAHQVYDSPLYDGPRPLNHPKRLFYVGGIAGVWRLTRILIAHNPWPLLLPWLVWLHPRDQFEEFLLLWVGLGYAAVFLTTFVPPLRFFGEGFKYLKFTAFPLAILIGRAFARWPEALAALSVLLLSAVAIWRFQRVRGFEVVDQDFQETVAFLKADPRERIASIPCHSCDPLAYLTGKRVLWGSHSAGYEKLESWFPVIRQRVPDVLDAYGVSLLLIDRQYVNPDDLRLDGDFRQILERGRFVLMERSGSGELAR